MMSIFKLSKNYESKREEESGNITYIYSPSWIKKRWRKKENKIKQLEKNVSKLRNEIKENLKSDDKETRLIALLVSLIDETKERIGNENSAEERKHYGVSTWLKKHVSFTNGKAKIKYVGKSGVDQEKVIENKEIVKALKDLVKDKKQNDKLFSDDEMTITPKMVNKYLSKFKISAKDIRGAEANRLMKEELKKQRKGGLPKDEKEKEKKLKEEFNKALDNVSKILGHESSTLKNQYIIPTITETYLSSGKVANKEFKLSKRAGQTFTDKKNIYSVDMLIELTKSNKIENVPIKYIKWNLKEKVWGNGNISPNDVLENPNKYKKYMKDINDAELKYPIMLHNGEIIDGYHRLAKVVKQGKTSIKAIELTNKQLDISRIDKERIKELNKKADAQILIEPYDTAVAKAYQTLPADIKNSIKKIIVHPEGGAGQLGHVEMGPGKDPQEVHIFKNRILEQIKNMFGTTQPTPAQLEDATHKALVETLIHEGVHIGPPEQVINPNYRFRDEPSTEQETKRRMLSQSKIELEKIRNKYLPLSPMVEPDLEFINYCFLNEKYNMVKKGISLLKNNKIKTASKNFPRNFGTVIPNKLYRGGIIDDIYQLQELKNLGIQRVISLHNNPEIGRMCNQLNMEHIPAPIETGNKEEYGRKILGESVSKLLLEKPTYIHCWFGADRTGGVIARFRTENGWSNKDAYLEAKSYGFKDMFCDLIDWFSEVNGEPPINTRRMRRRLMHRNPNCPYRNPEIEQDALSPTPNDHPLEHEEGQYETWDNTSNVNYIMSLTPPVGRI